MLDTTNIIKMAKDKNTDLFAVAQKTLLDLAKNVSQRDKMEAAIALIYSTRTIDRYLKGDVRDLDTATNLIKFFKGKTEQRQKQIAA